MKKRIIFTLFYAEGNFYLSRNFTIQKVGGLNWLENNYNFSKIAYSIDELVILDISRGPRNIDTFGEHVKQLSHDCFVPVAAGGGIRSIEDARQLLRNGADKVVVNTLIDSDPNVVNKISREFGRQSVIASVDVKSIENEFRVFTCNGKIKKESKLEGWIDKVLDRNVGEIYLNSISRDGTGQGYQLKILDHLPVSLPVPLILAGGAGKAQHFIEGLKDERVDAVATGHLFNFVGDGLIKARNKVVEAGINVAKWNPDEVNKLYKSVM